MLQAGRLWRPDQIIEFFSIYLILPAALGLGVCLASNRNEYQKQKEKSFWGVESDQCIRVIISPPSVSRVSRQCGILNSSQTCRPPQGVHLYILVFPIC
jgi:hypothetical protein